MNQNLETTKKRCMCCGNAADIKASFNDKILNQLGINNSKKTSAERYLCKECSQTILNIETCGATLTRIEEEREKERKEIEDFKSILQRAKLLTKKYTKYIVLIVLSVVFSFGSSFLSGEYLFNEFSYKWSNTAIIIAVLVMTTIYLIPFCVSVNKFCDYSKELKPLKKGLPYRIQTLAATNSQFADAYDEETQNDVRKILGVEYKKEYLS